MNLNSANELSFTVYKEVDGIIEPLWNKIKDFRLVYVKELNEYYQIKISTNNGTDDITKTISAISLCEAELSQIYIRDTEINTENDIARDDYVVTKFYSLTDKKASLLDRILSFAPHYKIGHVDDSLIELQRSFSIDNTSIYDFLTGDCSEQFNCLFQFNSVTRTINVYDLYTRCLNPECGYRGDFDEVCPKCGSKKISYFGEDTSIFINSKNLSDSITFETDDDSVKNCFKIEGGDDDINAAIRNVNPNGTDVIYYITDDQKEEMSDELVQKINSYDTLYNEKIDTYRTLNQNIYDAYDKILYYTSSMMPTVEHEEVTATTEADKLTHIDLENGSFSFAGDKIVYDSFSNDLCLKDITVKFVSDGKIDKTTLQDVITGVNTNYLKLHKLESETIVAINGRIDNLKSITITTENFYAKFSEIDIAKIKELYTDSAFIRSLTTAVSSTVTSTVDTEFVKNLIVGHATLNDLFTSNFTIGSDDGGSVLMNGSTMQFKDKDGNVYVQIGTDKTGGHSIIINDSNGTAIMNGSGITSNAIADGLIVDQMVKKKDTSYNGISGDKLDIDSVITNINGSTTTIKSSQIYFDEDKQTLNTKLSTMQNTLSSEMINEVAKNKTYTAKIESSNGTVLAETLNKNTTLTCNVKNANDVVNIDGTNYRAVWTRRTASGGTQDSAYNVISTSVSVAYTDISTDYIYTCTVQKIENNQWHDVISAEITIAKNIYEVLKTEYYTKEESPKAILTILGETEISTVNGKENSIISTIQTTHETVDTFEKVIEKNNTTINDFVNKSASVYQNYDEFKTTVKKTYATNTKVDELANGNNLLRNSDTLIFDEYIIGSKLIDASNNILVDRNGYILVG